MLDKAFEVLQRLDDFLMDFIFEPTVKKIQTWTGKNNFWLARLVCYVTFLMFSLYGLFVYNRESPYFGIGCWVYIFYETMKSFKKIKRSENRYEDQVNKYGAYLNLTRIEYSISRPLGNVLFILISITLPIYVNNFWYNILGTTGLFFNWLIDYLISCTPLPPSQSMIKALFKKWMTIDVNVLAEEKSK